MDKYNIKLSKIFRGMLCLLLCGILLWFTWECFLVYTPFANKLSFRDIGGNYVEGKVTELKRASEEYGSVVLMIVAEYQVGFQKVKSYLPPHLWYHEGLEEGDKIFIPYSQKSFDDMSREDGIVLFALLFVFGIFLIRGLVLIIGELTQFHYFQGLIANKKYITATVTDIRQLGKKSCAICSFRGHTFKSRHYRTDEFHFRIGEEVKVYVDIENSPEKYLFSNN